MCIDGDVLELDMEMDLEEVKALHLFVKDRLAYIEEIVVLASQNGVPSTSSLFALLHVIKQEKPSIKIDFIIIFIYFYFRKYRSSMCDIWVITSIFYDFCSCSS